MPLARAAMYQQGIDIYLAPTWDNSDTWGCTLRHIAREGRLFVVGTNTCLHARDIPQALPGAAEIYAGDEDDWLSRGNTMIVGPDGALLAGPLTEQPGLLTADVDVSALAAVRREFDPVGHYARPDVFQLVVHQPSPAPAPRASQSTEYAPSPIPKPTQAASTTDGAGASKESHA